MKKLIFTLVLVVCTLSIQAQTKTIQKDSVPLFYGLTAKKILALSVPEAKALMKEKEITVSEYFQAKARAELYLDRLEIKKDSIETMRIYGRIGKKLSMKKDGRKN